jgi:aminoglycoside 6'-N-acetyltransferase I
LVEFAKEWSISHGCSELASDCELDNEYSRLFHSQIGFEEANRIICFTMNLKGNPHEEDKNGN